MKAKHLLVLGWVTLGLALVSLVATPVMFPSSSGTYDRTPSDPEYQAFVKGAQFQWLITGVLGVVGTGFLVAGLLKKPREAG